MADAEAPRQLARRALAAAPLRRLSRALPLELAHIATAAVLAGILLAGLQLRVTNVNWDHGQHLHPDERYLSIISSQIRLPGSAGEYFDSQASPLNPYNYSDTFVYGTFPIFLNKAVAEWLAPGPDGKQSWTADLVRRLTEPLGVEMRRADGTYTFDAGYNSNYVGRVLSALADVVTIALVFEMGRLLYGRAVGLMAAGLLSLTVLHIQYSHFFGSETFLALFVTATLYFSLRILKYGGGWNYALAGVCFGLAMATKLNALPVLAAPFLAAAVRAARELREQAPAGPRQDGWAPLRAPAAGAVALLACALLVFRIAQPYAFEGPGFFDIFDLRLDLPRDLLSPALLDPRSYLNLSDAFVQDITNLRNQQTGSDFPPNVQWIGRSFILFPLGNIVLWGMGIPLALAALASLVYAARRGLTGGDAAALLLVLWAAGYFLFVARGFNPTMRYFLPIYPAMVVLAALGLVELWRFAVSGGAARTLPGRLASLRAWSGPVLQAVVVLAVAGTALWALAFTGIYRQDISRVQASYWIARNLSPGSVLTVQEWDDGIPLHLPGIEPARYRYVTLKPYVQDSPEKVRELVAGLDRAQYVVETSNRLYDSIPRNPARYPSTTRYYRYLFDGSLGFEKVAEFTNYPTLFGIEIPTQSAEEAFSVYDHPKVTIWRKTERYSSQRALALLNPDAAALAVSLPPAEADRNALLLRPDDLEAQRRGGTWTSVFSDGGLAASHPTLVWLLALQAAAFAVTPMALLLFRGLPDRGYLLAKPLGLLLLAYPVWLLVSLKLVTFSQTTVLLVLAALVLAGGALLVAARDEMLSFFRRRWLLLLFSEALFLAAFFFFRELRLENPDLWHLFRGGEKPMDVAYLTAVTRSSTLPPYDPWLAGGYINYYYLGHFFTATLSRLTTIPPEVTFNLAVPAFFAYTCAAAFSIAYNLAASVRSFWQRAGRSLATPGWSPLAAGLFGVFLVAVAGNLDGAGQLAERLSAVSPWRLESSLPLLPSLVNSAGGLWQVLVHGARLEDFDYWRPSRMLPPTISITEFPFFSFLFADLHAHMMAIPFQLLAIGGALSLALRREGERIRLQEWLLVAFLGLAVGSLRALNSWDYPPFLLLALAALLIGERGMEGGPLATAKRLALKGALLAGLSLLLFKPFLDNYQSPATGLRSSPETTPLHQYLAHFGVFVALIGVWLAYEASLAWRRLSGAEGPGGGGGRWAAAAAVGLPLLLAACIALVLQGLFFVAVVLPVLVLTAVLAGALFLTRPPDAAPRLFLLALAGLGLGLSAGVDLVTIEGDINRMNTVFKFYLHVWAVFALAAAFAGWLVLFVLLPSALASQRRPLRTAAGCGAVALSLLVLTAAIYPALATPVRLDDRFVDLPRTLDGMEFMRHTVYQDARGGLIDMSHDYEGIQWLRRNAEGTPVLVEGRGELYRSVGSRFSIYTGLPAVVGWDWHQRQQRGKFAGMVEQRNRDVDAFYQSVDPAQALRFLRRYEVSYVILGQLERLYYPGPGLLKLENGLGGVLRPVYSNPGLTIFEVRTDLLASLSASLP